LIAGIIKGDVKERDATGGDVQIYERKKRRFAMLKCSQDTDMLL